MRTRLLTPEVLVVSPLRRATQVSPNPNPIPIPSLTLILTLTRCEIDMDAAPLDSLAWLHDTRGQPVGHAAL